MIYILYLTNNYHLNIYILILYLQIIPCSLMYMYHHIILLVIIQQILHLLLDSNSIIVDNCLMSILPPISNSHSIIFLILIILMPILSLPMKTVKPKTIYILIISLASPLLILSSQRQIC